MDINKSINAVSQIVNFDANVWMTLFFVAASIVGFLFLLWTIFKYVFSNVNIREKNSRKNLSWAVLFCSFGWLGGTFFPASLFQLTGSSQSWPPKEGILDAVKERKHLRCGINPDLAGFSRQISQKPDENGFLDDVRGFDADFCRVVAAAIFGDPKGKVKFLPLRAHSKSFL